MIGENLKMAGRSITDNKLRTLLTMLGIMIGVGAVVSINSLGLGLKQVITRQVSDLGANVIIMTSGKIPTAGSKGGFNPTSTVGTSTLTVADTVSVKHNPHVLVAAPLGLISGIVANGTATAPTATILATTPDILRANPTEKVDRGRFLQSSDDGQNVAAIGAAARDALFGAGIDGVGKTIKVRGHDFTVIGVMKTASEGTNPLGSTFDNAVFISSPTAKALTGSEPQILRIIVQARSQADVQPATVGIHRDVLNNHGGQDDFSVLTQKDILSTFDTILGALTSAISAIAAISLLVGGIGIMNIMLVSVSERTKEIGLRKALGATSGMVLSQFLIEAVVLTVMGGLFGVGLAFLGGIGIQNVAHITPVFDLQTILLACGISGAIGLIFGIAPAIKAARMKPIDALRYE